MKNLLNVYHYTGNELSFLDNTRKYKMLLQELKTEKQMKFYRLTVSRRNGKTFKVETQKDILTLKSVVDVLRKNGEWSLAISRINEIQIKQRWHN